MAFNMHEQMDTAANAIITKYLFEEMSQELCDAIMDDLLRVFGPSADAHVTLDTDDHSIEIKLKDILTNVRTYKVSRLGKIEDKASE